MEDNSLISGKFYDSSLEQSINNINEIFNTNIDSINNDYKYNHYFCTKCYKFPFIRFCKDRKNVRMTCSCFNNKKLSIEELFKIIYIKNIEAIFLPESNLNINIENQLKCEEHNKKFKGFSKYFLNNYCENCYKYKNEINDNNIIKFDDIKIEEKKIEELIKKINNNNDDISEEISEEISNNIIIFNKNNENDYEKISKDDKRFKRLINVIINDYKNYPNFTHFFNIKNLLNFFNIEDKSIEKEENIIDDNLIEKNEPIIIEYINNISKKTKLFGKIFVENNKNKCSIEIEGKRLELIEDYEFKTKKKKGKSKIIYK